MDQLLLLPFNFLKAPELRLKTPKYFVRPSASVVFVLVFLTYFLFLSGIIYDVITETPSVGGMRDPRTGAIIPQAILKGRINGQYIIEGLVAGFLFCLGGVGFMLLDRSVSSKSDHNLITLLVGILFIIISYNICIVFIRMKVPNYLR